MSGLKSAPAPVPPQPPVPGECCERGCERCMWDYYRLAQARYAEAEAAGSAHDGDRSMARPGGLECHDRVLDKKG